MNSPWLDEQKPSPLETALFSMCIELCKAAPSANVVFAMVRDVAAEIENRLVRAKENTGED